MEFTTLLDMENPKIREIVETYRRIMDVYKIVRPRGDTKINFASTSTARVVCHLVTTNSTAVFTLAKV